MADGDDFNVGEEFGGRRDGPDLVGDEDDTAADGGGGEFAGEAEGGGGIGRRGARGEGREGFKGAALVAGPRTGDFWGGTGVDNGDPVGGAEICEAFAGDGEQAVPGAGAVGVGGAETGGAVEDEDGGGGAGGLSVTRGSGEGGDEEQQAEQLQQV